MKSKLIALTLAVVAIAAVTGGGIVAADGVSSDSLEDSTETSDDGERLTADDSFELDFAEDDVQSTGGDTIEIDTDGE
ncbi:hypothetical protein [Halorussus amylolyticus]|uniref:hypothetical protein n=1 Tax=Halorussus amylolyticus TaxID=1126242 RepID=UPI00104AAC2C|nr:hypothetical protein [Halorussus amylolyticus]